MQGDDPACERAVPDVGEAGAVHQLGEIVRPGKPADARRQVRVGGAALEQLAEQWNNTVEPDSVERRKRSARPGDLEDRDAPVCSEHAAQLGQRPLQVGHVADAERDCRSLERPIGERKRQQVSLDPLDRFGFPPGALEHRLGEIETGDSAAGPLAGDGEVAGATARVEHAVARPDDCLRRDPPPAQVEAHRHHPVHHVVDGGDAVEHRPHLVRRQGARGHDCPHRSISVLSSPSWSSARATTKSTRSSTVSAPW